MTRLQASALAFVAFSMLAVADSANSGTSCSLSPRIAPASTHASVRPTRDGSSRDALRLSGGAPATGGFVVHYRCSQKWEKAFVHYSLDEGVTWSLKPSGLGCEIKQQEHVGTDTEMQSSPAGIHWRSFQLQGAATPSPPIKRSPSQQLVPGLISADEVLARAEKRTPLGTDKQTLCFVFHDGMGNWDSGPEKLGYYRVDKPGRYALKDGRVSEIWEGLPPVLVASDLDGTYVGDDAAMAELNENWERQCVHSQPRSSVFVYNTGRSWESTRKLMDEKSGKMMPPAAVIASVGTQVWWLTEDKNGAIKAVMDQEWEAALAAGGLWDRKLITELVKPFLEKDWAHFRPEDEQNNWKVVMGVRTKHVEEVIAQVERGLAEKGKAATLIASGHGDWNYLDVVCQGAGKLQALVHVRDKLKFDPQNTVACGDSGNDILMLSGQERGVIVGNAQEGLLKWVRTQSDVSSDGSARLVQTTASHARGIVEALRKMGFLPRHGRIVF